MNHTTLRTGAARAVLLAWVCAVSACGPSANTPHTDGGPDVPDAGEPAVPTRTVSGRRDAVYWASPTASSTVPADASRLFVTAEVRSEALWRTVPGVAGLDGTYSIPGMPLDGDYWLRVFDGTTGTAVWLWTNGPGPDLSMHLPGRADAVTAHDRSTVLQLRVGDLDPWQDSDALEIVSPGVGISKAAWPAYYAQNPPSADDTQVSALDLTWSGFPLVQASRGDALWLSQVRTLTEPVSGISFATPIRSVQLDPMEMTDGAQVIAQGTFSPAPDFEYALNWNRSAFNALKPDVHPTAQDMSYSRFYVHALPDEGAHGRLYDFEPVVVDNAFLPQDGTDLQITFAAHNPYPASWLVNGFECDFPVTVGLDDGSVQTELSGAIGQVTRTLSTVSDPVVPMLSPVRQVQVGGKETSANVTGVGLEPQVTWAAPATGTATSYELHLYGARVEREGGPRPGVRINMIELATLLVPGDVRAVTLPDDLLVDGQLHALQLRAIHAEGQDVRTAPFAHSLPLAWADAWTSFFTP